jgi:hypothetical protein
MTYESKVTARIDIDLYTKVQDNFYHGQQTLFFRNVFKSLEKIINENRFDEVTDYLYKGKSLTLPEIDNG